MHLIGQPAVDDEASLARTGLAGRSIPDADKPDVGYPASEGAQRRWVSNSDEWISRHSSSGFRRFRHIRFVVCYLAISGSDKEQQTSWPLSDVALDCLLRRPLTIIRVTGAFKNRRIRGDIWDTDGIILKILPQTQTPSAKQEVTDGTTHRRPYLSRSLVSIPFPVIHCFSGNWRKRELLMSKTDNTN